MNQPHLAISVALLLVLLFLTPVQSRADQITDVSFDTSALVGGGTFFINFQLTDGDATNNNTASLTAFTFGGGAAGDASTVQTIGGASGSLNAGTVTLNDSGFLNDFLQEFTPGNILGFRLTLTPPAFSGGTPDQFTFAIFDSAFQEVLTTDPLGTNVMLRVDINSTNPEVEQFAIRPIPEPTTMLLLGTGLAGVAAKVRKRRKAHKSG